MIAIGFDSSADPDAERTAFELLESLQENKEFAFPRLKDPTKFRKVKLQIVYRMQ